MSTKRGTAFGFLVLVLSLAAGGRASATPPSPPVDFALRTLETPRPGAAVRFEVEVHSRVPAKRVTIRIVPPKDVALGALRDTLTTFDLLHPDDTVRLSSTVRIPPGLRRYVYVRATVETVDGQAWTRGENLVLLAGPLRTPDPPARIYPDGHGGSLIEYEGASR